MGLFPDFLDKPSDIRFKEQEPDEHIELLLRRDKITNLPWVLAIILGYFVPIAVARFNLFGDLGFVKLTPPLIQAVLLVWYLGLFGLALVSFLNWYFNIDMVTNSHIVEIEFDSLLSTTVSSSEITDIQETHYSTNGIFQSIFHFGDVLLETASKGEPILFSKVHNPDRVCDRIQDMEEVIRKGQMPG